MSQSYFLDRGGNVFFLRNSLIRLGQVSQSVRDTYHVFVLSVDGIVVVSTSLRGEGRKLFHVVVVSLARSVSKEVSKNMSFSIEFGHRSFVFVFVSVIPWGSQDVGNLNSSRVDDKLTQFSEVAIGSVHPSSVAGLLI